MFKKNCYSIKIGSFYWVWGTTLHLILETMTVYPPPMKIPVYTTASLSVLSPRIVVVPRWPLFTDIRRTGAIPEIKIASRYCN